MAAQWALFFILWLLMAGQLNLGVCLWGAAAALGMTWFCRRVLEQRFQLSKGAWGRTVFLVRYLGHLLWEMLKAGFVVMRLIYTRGRDMRPKLVWFDTTLKSDAARVLLANSITLTAGTITVTAEDGRFCVHALDASLVEGIEHCEFQQRLEKLEADGWNS